MASTPSSVAPEAWENHVVVLATSGIVSDSGDRLDASSKSPHLVAVDMVAGTTVFVTPLSRKPAFVGPSFSQISFGESLSILMSVTGVQVVYAYPEVADGGPGAGRSSKGLGSALS